MITVEHLTKYYGETLAVKDLTFEIPEGGIYGLLGPNGAGKTTTMNILTGCLSPTSGRVTICGFDILEQPREAKRRVGYLPEQPPLYMNESPEEYLRFVGEVKGLRREALKTQIREVMERTGISDVSHRRISDLSKGYRQRVGIAQALLGDPKVIILDEPTVGLDPLQITQIRDLIRDLGKTHTVILSSHILSEVQALCQKILIISQGRLAAFDTPQALENKLTAQSRIRFRVEATREETEKVLDTLEGMGSRMISETEGVTQVCLESKDGDAAARRLFFAFAEAGKAIVEMTPARASLEDIFLELTERKEEEA